MENLPGNSKTSKVVKQPGETRTQDKKIEKVVTGPVIQRKTPLGRRAKEFFIGGDARDASQHVAESVLLPAIRDMILDGITSLAEGIIFGDNRNGARAQATRKLVNNATQSFVSYNRFGGNSTPAFRPDPRQDPRPQLSREARRNHDFREIVLATRAEGMEVLNRMAGLIQQYDTCSVSDLYTMLDISPDFTDESWGWDNLGNATVHRDGRRGGYVLVLPPPEPLG